MPLSIVRPAPTLAELIEDGKLACFAGKSKSDCPHPEATLAQFLWEQGWLAARCVA